MSLLLEEYYTQGFTKTTCCIITYVNSDGLNCKLRRMGSQEIKNIGEIEMKSWCLLPSLLAGNPFLMLPF